MSSSLSKSANFQWMQRRRESWMFTRRHAVKSGPTWRIHGKQKTVATVAGKTVVTWSEEGEEKLEQTRWKKERREMKRIEGREKERERGGKKKRRKKKKKKADSNLYQPLGETPAGGKISSAFEKRGSGEVYWVLEHVVSRGHAGKCEWNLFFTHSSRPATHRIQPSHWWGMRGWKCIYYSLPGKERQTGGTGGFAILRKCLGLVSRFPRFKMEGENRGKLIVSWGNGGFQKNCWKQLKKKHLVYNISNICRNIWNSTCLLSFKYEFILENIRRDQIGKISNWYRLNWWLK